MPLGDSITAANGGFGNYRVPLARDLANLPCTVEFVGSQTDAKAAGGLSHEGHGGWNAEMLAAHFPEWYRAHPADLILLHCGHNHTAEEHPVAGILSSIERIIGTARECNPRVIVFVAQVIPSGKLPKYAYLPELNAALPALVARLNRPDSPVLLVDQCTGFSVEADTVADRVHPNVKGAEKIAARWATALRPVLVPAGR